MKKIKQSFSVIELASYVAVMGALTVVVTGGMSVVKNAKVHRVVEELYFYENAISDFVAKYGELPGNMSRERCEMFNEFHDFCQPPAEDGTILNNTTLNSAKHSYVAMNEGDGDGLAGILNYGRFLKTSGFVENVKSGIDITLETTNLQDGKIKNYLPKVGIGDEVYMHYMYNNSTNRWNDGLIFTDSFNNAEGMFVNTGMNFFSFSDETEDAVIIIFSTLGRYIDTNKGGAFSADFMKRIDKKIDDGHPRTGYIVGLPQGADGDTNVAKTCDDSEEYFDNQDERILDVQYLKDTDNKNGCNLAYLSSINFSDMLANPKYFG